MCIYTYTHADNEIYFKKLRPHEFTEADKSQNLLSISWRPRKANDVNFSPHSKA